MIFLTLSWMMKERNASNKCYFIQQLLVILYGERDADLQMRNQKFIRTKRSERAKRAHSVLREVEKMGYKKFLPVPV